MSAAAGSQMSTAAPAAASRSPRYACRSASWRGGSSACGPSCRTRPAAPSAPPAPPCRRRPHPGCVPPTSRWAMIVKGGTDRRIRPPPAQAAAVGPDRGRALPLRRLGRGWLRRPCARRGRGAAAPAASHTAPATTADRDDDGDRASAAARPAHGLDRGGRRHDARLDPGRCRPRPATYLPRCAPTSARTSSSATSRARSPTPRRASAAAQGEALLRLPGAAGLRPRPARRRVHGDEQRQQPLLRLRAGRPGGHGARRCTRPGSPRPACRARSPSCTPAACGSPCSASRPTPTPRRCSTSPPPAR